MHLSYRVHPPPYPAILRLLRHLTAMFVRPFGMFPFFPEFVDVLFQVALVRLSLFSLSSLCRLCPFLTHQLDTGLLALLILLVRCLYLLRACLPSVWSHCGVRMLVHELDIS